MEKLKSLHEVVDADKRNVNVMWTDDESNLVPLELKYLHRDASKIKFHDSVPEIVKEHFSQALNLFIYSWFNYQFHVTASFLSFVTLELALKEKIKSESKGLRKLLTEAKKGGLISLEDSRIEILANLRNEYAHGENIMHNQSLQHIELCSSLINELFKE